MKKGFYLLILTTFFTIAVYSQATVPADSAKHYIGKTITVYSTVFGTKALEKLTFINLGAAYPNSLLTVVVFAKDYANFTSPPAELYANKKICVTGEVKEFKGKVEIVISKPDDIKIIE